MSCLSLMPFGRTFNLLVHEMHCINRLINRWCTTIALNTLQLFISLLQFNALLLIYCRAWSDQCQDNCNKALWTLVNCKIGPSSIMSLLQFFWLWAINMDQILIWIAVEGYCQEGWFTTIIKNLIQDILLTPSIIQPSMPWPSWIY